MNLSDLRDASDSAAERAASSLHRVSDVSLPDVSRLKDVDLPDVKVHDALDDVADFAGHAIEFAGDMAGEIVSQGGRGLGRAVRAARRNPEVALGVLAVVVLVLGFLAAKKSGGDEKPSFDAIS